MTREEAREAIKEAYGNSEYTDEIIKALEQEPRKDEVILTNEEYRELVSMEYENGYARGYREALEQEPKIKVLDRDEVIRKLGEVDVYTANAWVTFFKDLDILGMEICEVKK